MLDKVARRLALCSASTCVQLWMHWVTVDLTCVAMPSFGVFFPYSACSYLLAHPGRLWVPRSVATRIMHPQPSARFSLVPGDILPADLLDDTGQTSNPAASTAPPTPRSLAAATPGMRSVRESFDTGAAPRGVPRSRLGGIAAGDAFGAALAGISPSSSTTALAGHLPRQSLDGVPQMMLGVGGKADLHRPSPVSDECVAMVLFHTSQQECPLHTADALSHRQGCQVYVHVCARACVCACACVCPCSCGTTWMTYRV